ncbi:hypothetical protein FQN54_005479 [Arachnomyces sp. PD_36]|nr:hypothetical protein FQN54_005479 [Arachnomyces sp. PD_36]
MNYSSPSNLPPSFLGPIRNDIALSRSRDSPLRCCCGRQSCAYLQHNTTALEGLERDVKTAAQLGQDLLERHETYMADAEQDRGRLLMDIEKLELAKKEAEEENARIIEENRDLLEQLEGLNKSIIDSDAQIQSLTTKLESTQLQVRKLNVSAARVVQLEEQLDSIEKEQSQLQEKLILTEEDERSAVQRWRKAECTLRALQDQIEMIEQEARDEREKHVELISRMERRRAVEKELEGAAGRLKGAAATSTIGGRNAGPNVVSHFVRDILQDNANLQSGIVELKEMLQSSNEEVQNLREQVHLHQPLATESIQNEGQRKTLSDELEAKSPKRVSQEFHVHHHYHGPAPGSATPKKDKMPVVRRSSKKKRAVYPHGMVQSASGSSRGSRTQSSRNAHRSTSSASTIMSQTSVSIPPSTASHRLSSTTVSSSTYSSMPSSPQSSHRTSSVFDRVDHGFDSSRPTSPESSVFDSPNVTSRYRKRQSGNSFRSISSSTSDAHNSLYEHLGSDPARDHSFNAKPGQTDFGLPPSFQLPIPEEQEDNPGVDIQESEVEEINPPRDDDDGLSSSLPFHSIGRSVPERGIISVSGMDIHPLRHRPSQLLGPSAFRIRKPNRIVSPSAGLASTPPVISQTNITASTISLHDNHMTATSYSLLSSVAASTCIHSGTESSSCASSTYQSVNSDPETPRPRARSMGQRVGGWVRGKWGTAPVSSAASSVHGVPSSASSTVTANSTSTNATALILSRPPGVNQKGPIFGFKPPPPAPSSIHPSHVDEDLLKESLLEE